MMRIFVAGATGQVARALAAAPPSGFVLQTLGRPDFDLGRPESVEAAFHAFRPHLVINAAAYTAVDKAESDPGSAMGLNADGAALLARHSVYACAPIFHLSTDYVFAGDKSSPYVETDPVAPASAYGRSKLEGELRVASTNPRHLILRTAWVHSQYGSNFVRTMLGLAERRQEIDVVADQYGTPTYAPDIARSLIQLAARFADGPPMPWGVYHMASSGSCSWADVAEHVFDVSARNGGPSARVNRIKTSDYSTAAVRPANSRLNCAKLYSDFGIMLPDWRSGVERCVVELLGHGRDR